MTGPTITSHTPPLPPIANPIEETLGGTESPLLTQSTTANIEEGRAQKPHQLIAHKVEAGKLVSDDKEAVKNFTKIDLLNTDLPKFELTNGEKTFRLTGDSEKYQKLGDNYVLRPTALSLEISDSDHSEPTTLPLKSATLFLPKDDSGKGILRLQVNSQITHEYDLDQQTVQSGRVKVGDRILEDISHAVPDENNALYDTYDLVSTSGEKIPAAVVAVDFDDWNSNAQGAKQLTRSIAGLLTNASKDPQFDLRTALHMATATAVTAGLFIGLDTAAGKIQEALGVPVSSFTGAEFQNAEQKSNVLGAVGGAVTVAFILNSLKDALAIKSADALNPAEVKKIAALMFVLEVGGAQVIPGAIVAHSLSSEGLNSPKQAYINSIAPQMAINGLLATGIQSAMIAKDKSPIAAFAAYQAIRCMVFRPANVLVQSLTKVAEGGQVGKPEIESMALAQVFNEVALMSIGLTTYAAGSQKKPDGMEEQLLHYADKEGLPVNKLNRARLFVSEGVDKASSALAEKTGLNKVAGAAGAVISGIAKATNTAYAHIASSAFGASILNLSDADFADISALTRKTNALEETISLSGTSQEAGELYETLSPEGRAIAAHAFAELDNSQGEESTTGSDLVSLLSQLSKTLGTQGTQTHDSDTSSIASASVLTQEGGSEVSESEVSESEASDSSITSRRTLDQAPVHKAN